MEAFFRSLGLPVRLSDAGIGNERIAQMVETAMIGRESIGTLKRLEGSDIEKILKLAL
jgi:alcohol dehydrogenase YqhD (iron-dependent ADH family)